MTIETPAPGEELRSVTTPLQRLPSEQLAEAYSEVDKIQHTDRGRYQLT